MKSTAARRHVKTTVLANSENGHRGDAYYNRPVVLLSVDRLWTHRFRSFAPEGERVQITRAHPNTRPNGGSWDSGTTGWLALVWGERENRPSPEELLAVAAGLDVATFPDNAAEVALPKGYQLVTLMPATVHELPWAELQAKRRAEGDAADRRRERERREREESERRTRATLGYLREVMDLLGIDEPSFFPPGTAPIVPILRVLERLARAEGVELPPRPEHLRPA